jgi:hypothetical protein
MRRDNFLSFYVKSVISLDKIRFNNLNNNEKSRDK